MTQANAYQISDKISGQCLGIYRADTDYGAYVAMCQVDGYGDTTDGHIPHGLSVIDVYAYECPDCGLLLDYDDSDTAPCSECGKCPSCAPDTTGEADGYCDHCYSRRRGADED